jgi:single-strand DNA-binding protein
MVNKVLLIGSLGSDPEIRYTTTGTAVASISLATSEKFKNSEGKYEDKTEWHRLTAWGKLAEICGEFLLKGSKIYCEGKLQTRKWEKDGVTHYTTEVVMREMKMLSPRQGGGQAAGGDGGFEAPPMESDIPF